MADPGEVFVNASFEVEVPILPIPPLPIPLTTDGYSPGTTIEGLSPKDFRRR